MPSGRNVLAQSAIDPKVGAKKLMAVKARVYWRDTNRSAAASLPAGVQAMDVGFIGLGGTPMAQHLLKAGHRVSVYNRTRNKAEALAAKGAQIAGRVSEACKGEAVITMLGDDAAVGCVGHGLCLTDPGGQPAG